MKCPKCNIELYNLTCLKCGYMANGEIINTNKETKDKFYEEKLFNEKFDKLYRNEYILLPFVLGPLYFSFRGFLIVGTLLGILDYLFFYFLFNTILPLLPIINNTLIYYLLIFLNRLIYATVSNYICILIDKLKIKIIKRKYKNDYLDKLRFYKHKKIYLIFSILIYILIIVFIKIN